jgi:hypothetical protein
MSLTRVTKKCPHPVSPITVPNACPQDLSPLPSHTARSIFRLSLIWCTRTKERMWSGQKLCTRISLSTSIELDFPYNPCWIIGLKWIACRIVPKRPAHRSYADQEVTCNMGISRPPTCEKKTKMKRTTWNERNVLGLTTRIMMRYLLLDTVASKPYQSFKSLLQVHATCLIHEHCNLGLLEASLIQFLKNTKIIFFTAHCRRVFSKNSEQQTEIQFHWS